MKTLPFRDADLPVVLNVTAQPETRAAALRAALADQVTRPVRWVESVLKIKEMGAELMLEVGPGRVLSGLVRRTIPGSALLNVEDQATLRKTCAELESDGERTQ